jgi:hypothetical protein
VLDVGEDIPQDLAGMVFIGEAVDHGDAAVPRELFHDFLFIGADHHDIGHPRYHLGGVFHGLAAAQLRVACIQIDRRPAELVHAGFERKPCARRLLLENHDECPVDQRPVLPIGLELGLDPPGTRKQVLVFLEGKILELQEMPGFHFFAAAAGACSDRKSLINGTRMSTT